MLTELDVNSDMGEIDTADACATEIEMMPLLSSVNIACGGHAGTVESMRRTARLAARHAVAIGAHPGFPDRATFGRSSSDVSGDAVTRLIVEQVTTLSVAIAADGLSLTHVKLHGALYNQAATQPHIARAVVHGLLTLSEGVSLYALAGCALVAAARSANIQVVEEMFADRAYRGDGSLVPRSVAGALLLDEEAVRAQVRSLIAGAVTSLDGTSVPVQAESLCIHSDTPGAIGLARVVRSELDAAGIRVVAPSRGTRGR
ncbi:UPF0271 protein [Nitrospira sp.]|nr:UPF0271 protein [Nitrospira sp.]